MKILNEMPKTPVSGWGNYPLVDSDLVRPEQNSQLASLHRFTIPRGYGRSYGDASLNGGSVVVLMECLSKMLEFDDKTGLLRAEAGISLEEILEVFVPRGWFLPVTPGTKYVTPGGCVACDVHGKDHHIDGTFGKHVKELELVLSDGSRMRASPTLNTDLFWATIGGMGLTGIISEVTLQLIPIETAYMVVENVATENLDATLEKLSDPLLDEKYSVAWIDCLATGAHLGRSVVMTGHHAVKGEIASEPDRKLSIAKRRIFSIPFTLPSSLINHWTVKLFNYWFYKWQSRKKEPFLIDYDSFFFPLDAIKHWNRLYGKKGFVQYQFVVPAEHAKCALSELLQKLSDSSRPSFLAVLKRFGKEEGGMLSFPREGYTLALDIPVSNGLFPSLDELDALVLKYEGRLYLAKDARMKPSTFRAMYPRFDEWRKIKAQFDPKGLLSSELSRRLKMEQAP